MKAHFRHSIFAAFLILLFGMKAYAQISFTADPSNSLVKTDFSAATLGGTATVSSGQIPIAPTSTVNFQISIYRAAGSPENGYVTIYAGTTPPGTSGTNSHILIDNTITQNTGSTYNTNSKQWAASGGKEYFLIRGEFSTSSIRTGDTKLYAVYFNTSRNVSGAPTLTAVSDPLTIVPGSVNSPGAGGGGGSTSPTRKPPTYTFCINAGDPVPKLDATYDLSALTNRSDIRILWRSSVDGGKTWNEVYEMSPAQDEQSFQPSPVERTTIYSAREDIRDCTYVLWGCHWRTLETTPWFVVNVVGKTPIPVEPFATVCISDIKPVTVSVAATPITGLPLAVGQLTVGDNRPLLPALASASLPQPALAQMTIPSTSPQPGLAGRHPLLQQLTFG
jgi:hypothetical protein